MRILFMGTPQMAVPTLESLIDSGHSVVAAVCQPDRPRGRRGAPVPPAVKRAALAHTIPVWQPERVRAPDFIEQVTTLAPDVAVVIAFGQILPPALLDIPRYGCINIHASLLPGYRGAAPINWAIARGETGTGLTTMRMDAGMDTGPVYLKAETPIEGGDDAVTLAERLAAMAGPLVLETLERVADGMIPDPQDDGAATLAPLLTRDDGVIDWGRPAREVVNRIRAFVPWPGSVTHYRGTPWKVIRARVDAGSPRQAAPGRILRVDGDGILVASADTGVRIEVIQLPGKRPLAVRDFLNGHPVERGASLSSSRESQGEP